MTTMKKAAALMMAGILCSSALTAVTFAADGAKIGFVNEANTDVFDNTRMTALQTLADEVGGYNIEYSDANLDIQKQIDQANTFLSKNVDILMLVPCDSDAIIPAIQNANRKGTPTICFGIKANGGDFVFVGSDSYDAGYMQGELMAEQLPENATVCYLAGTAGLEHSTLRRQGFQEALKEKGREDVQIIEDQDAQYTKAKAMEKVDAWIQSYADGSGGVTFNAIVAANDQMALGAVESLKGANILKGNNEILISGIDGTPDAVAAVADGYMVQTVLQDAAGQAKAGLEAVDKLMAGEEIPDNQIMVPFVNITQENVADFQ